MFLEKKSKVTKLVSVLATTTPVIVAKEKAVNNIEDGKNPKTSTGIGEDDQNLRSNLVQVLCIQYLIAF